MPDLLDQIRRELQQRLEASRAAVREHEQLQAALVALDESGRGAPAAARSTAATKDGRDGTAPTRRRRPARAPRQRAPHGQNRERVLAVVRERPGVTPLEIAAAAGIKGATLYTVLRRLVDAGTVEKREVPGGDTGYSATDA